MAATYGHHIEGRALINYQFYDSNGQLTGSETALGYSLNGVDLNFTASERPIPGDQNGGVEGPPVDVILHGLQATVSFILVDYNRNNLEKVITHAYPSNLTSNAGGDLAAGWSQKGPASGTLLLAGYRDIQLSIVCTDGSQVVRTWEFPHTWVSNPQQLNLSTNETQYNMVFQAISGGIGDADGSGNRSPKTLFTYVDSADA